MLPIVHEVVPVNMNTLRLEVSRGRDKALITKDRMRVDVVSEFYVRVQASVDAIASAAQTLGQRTLEPETLKELVEGKFVDALRTVAAEMTMEEMHEKRGEYVKRVKAVVAADLLQNGLELEAVSLTQLDQTGMEFFNPSNAFDAEGLTRLTEQIERRKKIRNDIEQDTMIQVRNKNLETERQALDIDRELEYARLAQERELEVQRATQRADVARQRAEQEQEAERAQIAAREAVDRARIASERAVEEDRIAREREVQQLEIARRQAIELAEQQRAIAVAEQSKAQSEAQAAADLARAKAVAEEERVFTARETEMAERRKRIDLIGAAQEAERDALRVRIAAEAEKGGRRRPRRGGARRGGGPRRRGEGAGHGRPDPQRGGGGGAAAHERGAEPPHPGGAAVRDAHAAHRQARGHRARVGEAHGADRGHQDPARRRPRRRGRRPRRRARGRQLRGQRGQLRPALPGAGAAGRPAAARDRRRRRRRRQGRPRPARPQPDRAARHRRPERPRPRNSCQAAHDQGLRLERDRRARGRGVGADPRLQRPAQVDAVRGRVAHRGRAAPPTRWAASGTSASRTAAPSASSS